MAMELLGRDAVLNVVADPTKGGAGSPVKVNKLILLLELQLFQALWVEHTVLQQ